jgi:hypothetical protein
MKQFFLCSNYLVSILLRTKRARRKPYAWFDYKFSKSTLKLDIRCDGSWLVCNLKRVGEKIQCLKPPTYHGYPTHGDLLEYLLTDEIQQVLRWTRHVEMILNGFKAKSIGNYDTIISGERK